MGMKASSGSSPDLAKYRQTKLMGAPYLDWHPQEGFLPGDSNVFIAGKKFKLRRREGVIPASPLGGDRLPPIHAPDGPELIPLAQIFSQPITYNNMEF